MTDRDDVERLRLAQARIVEMAIDDIADLASRFDWSTPEAAREALLEIVPSLVREYGDIAATAAAEWYEETRPMVLGPYPARTVDPVPVSQAEQSARALLGDADTADAAISAITDGLQRLIQYSGRATIARNVQLDPGDVRFARVPRGAKTCAWCSLLASRGFVYYNRETAGALMQFHDVCDCQIVASWDANNEHIAGYDPDALYDQYLGARDALAEEGNRSPTDRQIASRMRTMFPGAYTDGVWHTRTISGVDGEVTLRAKTITHIVDGDRHGGGHISGTGTLGKTEFPPSWDADKILDAITRVLESPSKSIDRSSPQVRIGIVDGVVVAVKVTTSASGVRVTTAFPMSGAGVVRNTKNGPVAVPLNAAILDDSR